MMEEMKMSGKRHILLFAFIIMAFTKISVCSAADYFPLEVGNVWYIEDRGNYQMSLLDNKIVVDDNELFHFHDRAIYYRKDDSGKVYKIFDPSMSERVMYDLSADVGESWLGGGYKANSFEYTITLESKTDTVETPAETFYNCYRFRFSAPENVSDADRMEWLAPDIGLVKLSSSWGTRYLQKALINGVKIETTPQYPEVERTVPETGGLFDRYSIVIDFNWPITLNSVTAENFKLNSAKEGDFPYNFDFYKENIANNFVYIHPLRPFAYDDTIYVTVSSAVKDYTGDHLQNDYSFFVVSEAEPIITMVKENLPDAFSLLRNYPNPFNMSTTISFSLPEACKPTLIIYNFMGQKVRELVSSHYLAGIHSIIWDGKDDTGQNVSSGIYVSKLESGKNEATSRMLLIK